MIFAPAAVRIPHEHHCADMTRRTMAIALTVISMRHDP
jgi:hypothetical protein